MIQKGSFLLFTLLFFLSLNVLFAEGEPIKSIVEANNRFAFDLYAQYKSKEGNIFFSPLGLSFVLATVYEGARGTTAKEIQSVFHFSEDGIARRTGFSEIHKKINNLKGKTLLKIANALWAQNDYPFLEDYVRIIKEYYDTKAENINFKDDPEGSCKRINQWIEEKTSNRIKNPISQPLDSLTRLVITNAVYFKSKWYKRFSPFSTRTADFRVSRERTVKIKMMMMKDEDFYYFENDKLQILELPYLSGEGSLYFERDSPPSENLPILEELSMLILLPKEDNLKDLEESLNIDNFYSWRNNLVTRKIDYIYIPKFKFETKYFLKEVLSNMGMKTVFSETMADFSGMTSRNDLFIEDIIHQSSVEVTEEGTEASSAIMAMFARSIKFSPIVFRADHPFIFIIQDRKTGYILFLGRLSDPTR